MNNSYETLIKTGCQQLSQAGIADAECDAYLLLEYVCHVDKGWYFAHANEEVPVNQAKDYYDLIAKRKQHIPLQHLTKEAWFYGLPFWVNDKVLIPRQDTECLVEEVLKRCGGAQNILDLCSGSGCILLSLLHERPQCKGIGADISEEALLVARENGKRLSIPAKFIWSNLFSQIKGSYDIIVSNPPYIPTHEIDFLMEEVRVHEPNLALDGKEDGLYFYREIVSKAGGFLNRGGWLCFEIGYDQGKDLTEMLNRAGYQNVEVFKDLAGHDRVALGQWN